MFIKTISTHRPPKAPYWRPNCSFRSAGSNTFRSAKTNLANNRAAVPEKIATRRIKTRVIIMGKDNLLGFPTNMEYSLSKMWWTILFLGARAPPEIAQVLGSCNNVQTERKIFEYANGPRLQIKRTGLSSWFV